MPRCDNNPLLMNNGLYLEDVNWINNINYDLSLGIVRFKLGINTHRSTAVISKDDNGY